MQQHRHEGPQLRVLFLFAFILLTATNGEPVWVDSTSVDIIRTHTVQCHGAHGAVIRVGATTLCVKETSDQIQQKIKDANEGGPHK